MKVQIVFSCLLAMVSCRALTHESSDGHKATSYQNIHIQHFHAVPTYVKKEHAHLLEHPIAKGETSSEVKVHHGDKHDHGYATSNVHSDLGKEEYASGHEGYAAEGQGASEGHAEGQGAAAVGYEGHGEAAGHYVVSGGEGHGYSAEGATGGQGYSQGHEGASAGGQSAAYDVHDLSHFQGHEYQQAGEQHHGLGHYQ